jgi:enhancing lycopene biosynthesis protein 2
LIIPGGFGVAKNLSNFATQGEKFQVEGQVERILIDFHKNNKFIGACCIAPILLGKVFGISSGKSGSTITLGSDGVLEFFY